MQKLFALLLLCLFLLPHPAQASEGTRIGIAAIVNDDAITWSDIDNRARLFVASANKGAPPPEARKQIEAMVLSRLIDERLQLREAKNLGIAVPDEQLQKAFADIARQNSLTPEQFRDRLQGSGIKMSTLTDQIKAELAWSLVVRRKLRPQIVVSETEIDTAMGELQNKKGHTEYQVAEILLKVPAPEMETTVRTDAEKLVQQITKGAQFSLVARQVSQAPGAATGGDLGWLQEGLLDKALDAQLTRMHPGEVSPPIRTDKGYHILFLRNLRDAGSSLSPQAAQTQMSPQAAQPVAPQTPPQVAASAPAANPARPGLVHVQAETMLHLKQLVIPVATGEAAVVTNAKWSRAESLKNEIRSCDAMEQKSREFLAEGTGDLGRSSLSLLPEPLRKAVAALPEGQLSEPVKTDNGIAVLMVCAREDVAGSPVAAAEAPAAPPEAPQTPAPAPVQAAAPAPAGNAEREQVANQIGLKRLNQLAERYLKDLRATAYIERR